MQIDKNSFESLIAKIDEIHKQNTEKTLLRDTIEILETAIAFNVSQSTIYQVLNADRKDNLTEINIDKSILNKRVRCDVHLIESNPTSNAELNSSYKWTGSKTDIVEMLEAILLTGSINNGNVTKKEFYEFIGKVLQIDLSHHNNILDNIYKRKDYFGQIDGRIRFLPMLVDTITRKLQERDNK